MARQLKLTVHHITPGGDYVPYEVPGPPSFLEWLAAYRVFSIGMRALRAATSTRLLIYQNKVGKFNDTYGQVCWWLVAQADQRMRTEQLERIRRKAEEERNAAVATGGVHPFDPLVPWDYCLKAAAADKTFWDEEIDRKCVLFITHLKTQKQLTDPGHGLLISEPPSRQSASGGAGNSSGGPRRGGARNSRGRGTSGGAETQGQHSSTRGDKRRGGGISKGGGKGKAKQPDGRWRVTEGGIEICYIWNHGEGGCSDICANGRAHMCEWCRSPKHRSIACSQKPSGWTP